MQSILSNAPVSLIQIIFMRFRKVNPGTIVTARITARKAGIEITGDELEAHYLAGGNVVRVVQALISASKANIVLTYDRSCAIDLAGRERQGGGRHLRQSEGDRRALRHDDPQHHRRDRGGRDPAQGKGEVTVRTNLERLVGGATEETVVARVGEGIVTTIGVGPKTT